MHRPAVMVSMLVLGLVLVAAFTISRISLSAMNEPGSVETYLAGAAKHFLVRRASYKQAQVAPPAASMEGAAKLYSMECAFCHGTTGGPGEMEVGGWMNPRAPNLTALDAKRYTDQELFWIIKNGIRFTGMPAFGKVETDLHIWKLVRHIREMQKEN